MVVEHNRWLCSVAKSADAAVESTCSRCYLAAVATFVEAASVGMRSFAPSADFVPDCNVYCRRKGRCKFDFASFGHLWRQASRRSRFEADKLVVVGSDSSDS